jgi:hypothetical protein
MISLINYESEASIEYLAALTSMASLETIISDLCVSCRYQTDTHSGCQAHIFDQTGVQTSSIECLRYRTDVQFCMCDLCYLCPSKKFIECT